MIRHSGGIRARREPFQRHPEGKGTKLDTGLRRYDVNSPVLRLKILSNEIAHFRETLYKDFDQI